MAQGGKRPGSGRPKGAQTKRNREATQRAADAGLTPLDYMMSILANEQADQKDRMWAAEKAAPYVHPKLANVEHTGKDGGDIGVIFKTTYESK